MLESKFTEYLKNTTVTLYGFLAVIVIVTTAGVIFLDAS